MARPYRVDAPGALHHVTARCQDEIRVLGEAADGNLFISMLADTVKRTGWQVLAYTLMSNHHHLLVRTPESNLSRGMQWLQGVWAQRFNLGHARRGGVWADRFHSKLIEDEAHLLNTAVYIALNPVRARLVDEATDWRWSSAAATAGIAHRPLFLHDGPILASLGDMPRKRFSRLLQDQAAWIRSTAPFSGSDPGV
ncbi:MAG: REP-associated tyrosine transposase [Gaiella sp.]